MAYEKSLYFLDKLRYLYRTFFLVKRTFFKLGHYPVYSTVLMLRLSLNFGKFDKPDAYRGRIQKTGDRVQNTEFAKFRPLI